MFSQGSNKATRRAAEGAEALEPALAQLEAMLEDATDPA
jgi:hypothetical protein